MARRCDCDIVTAPPTALDNAESSTEAHRRGHRALWREGISAELQSLFEKGVHEDIPTAEVPKAQGHVEHWCDAF
jgi:hypothetical protein